MQQRRASTREAGSSGLKAALRSAGLGLEMTAGWRRSCSSGDAAAGARWRSPGRGLAEGRRRGAVEPGAGDAPEAADPVEGVQPSQVEAARWGRGKAAGQGSGGNSGQGSKGELGLQQWSRLS